MVVTLTSLWDSPFSARLPDATLLDASPRRRSRKLRLLSRDCTRLGSLFDMESEPGLIDEVGSWEGVTLAEGRFGSVRFLVGRRELGHLHGQTVLDMPLSKPLKAELIERGEAIQHRWARPDSGWVTIELEPGPAGVERGAALLRERYQHAIEKRDAAASR
jgi:Family of unknown function (DUF5519)